MAKGKKKRRYQPRYPHTLLDEAVKQYEDEVFTDDEARNKFLTHIQPLVKRLVRRSTSVRGGSSIKRVDDVVSFVNTKLLESWLPKFLPGRRKVKRIKEAARYLSKSIDGYVIDFIKLNYDPRTVPFNDSDDRLRPFVPRLDRENLDAAYERMLEEHIALRPRPDLDVEVVEKLMRHLAWEEYRRTDGLPG